MKRTANLITDATPPGAQAPTVPPLDLTKHGKCPFTADAVQQTIAAADALAFTTAPKPTPATDDRRPTRCTRYRWCAQTGEHTDHTSTMITAACEDAYGNGALDMRLFDWGGGIEVGILDLDHTPAEARIVLAQLRAHLDIVERFIDIAEVGE